MPTESGKHPPCKPVDNLKEQVCKILDEKQPSQYQKNLLRFHDDLSGIKSERKRKGANPKKAVMPIIAA